MTDWRAMTATVSGLSAQGLRKRSTSRNSNVRSSSLVIQLKASGAGMSMPPFLTVDSACLRQPSMVSAGEIKKPTFSVAALMPPFSKPSSSRRPLSVPAVKESGSVRDARPAASVSTDFTFTSSSVPSKGAGSTKVQPGSSGNEMSRAGERTRRARMAFFAAGAP